LIVVYNVKTQQEIYILMLRASFSGCKTLQYIQTVYVGPLLACGSVQIPGNTFQFLSQSICIVHGNDEHTLIMQRVSPIPLRLTPNLGIKHQYRHVEFLPLLQLKRPLPAQRCRAYHQQPTLTFRPKLAQHNSRLDSLAKTDFVGKNDSFGKRRGQCHHEGMILVIT